jgi:hypothetical protein
MLVTLLFMPRQNLFIRSRVIIAYDSIFKHSKLVEGILASSDVAGGRRYHSVFNSKMAPVADKNISRSHAYVGISIILYM